MLLCRASPRLVVHGAAAAAAKEEPVDIQQGLPWREFLKSARAVKFSATTFPWQTNHTNNNVE